MSQDLSALTEREQEVLALIGRGLSNQEIAEVLCIACGTVRSHINRIYGKAGLRRHSQAVRYAIEQGLVIAPPEQCTPSQRKAACVNCTVAFCMKECALLTKLGWHGILGVTSEKKSPDWLDDNHRGTAKLRRQPGKR